MQKELFIVAIMLLLLQPTYAQKLKSNQFAVNGRINGMKSGLIYLNYLPGEGKTGIIDSSVVRNGAFTFKGFISEPCKALLSLFNLFSPNYTYDKNNINDFYLEAGTIKVATTYNQFSQLRVSGSSLDSERVRLQKTEEEVLNISQKKEAILGEYGQEWKSTSDTAKRKLLKLKMDSLSDIIDTYWKQKLVLDSIYIIRHPNSYLAADMLANNSYSNIAFPSLVNLYSKFPGYIRESTSGRKIKFEIEKEKHAYKGGPAYDFVALTDRKDTINLELFKGKKYVLLDFWASWCGPCRRLTPVLKDLYSKYKDQLEIISISFNDKEDAWLKAIGEDKPGWPQILGNGIGSTLIPADKTISDLYNIDLLPSVILIDKNSLIVEKFGGWYNAKSTNALIPELDRLFSSKDNK